MEWYEADVLALIARLTADPVANPAAFYGSSSMTLWSTMASDLRSDRVVNAGFGGSTLAACVHFFDRIISPLRPASLVVYAGDNDLGDGRSPDDVCRSFVALANRLDATCGPVPFGYISIKPSPARVGIIDRIRRTNDLVRAEIERRPNGVFVPMYDFMLRGGAPRRDLFGDDGLHLNGAGYALWTQLLEPFRAQLFAPRAVTPPPATT